MWLLPSYGRTERLAECLDAAVKHGMTTPGVVLVNDDDPSDYESAKLPDGWTLARVPGSPRSAGCYRHGLELFPNEPWYGFLCDDVLARTDGWDKALVETAGDFGIVSANDLWQAPGRMHGATVIGGGMMRAIGYISVPGVQHHFTDDMWETIGRTTGVWKTLMEVVTEHCHTWNAKAPMDQTYERNGTNLGVLKEDQPHWEAWTQGEKQLAIGRAMNAMGRKSTVVDMTNVRVAICTPAYGGMLTTTYTQSLLGTVIKFIETGIGFDFITVPNESLIQRARNGLLKEFLDRKTCSHMLFVDADMGWSPDAVMRLIAIAKMGHPIVGAAGPRKQTPLTFCCNFESGTLTRDDATGCLEVKEIGTGFLMIAREAAEKMVEAYPDRVYTDALTGIKYTALFEAEIRDGFQWSEDYTFCHRARAIGLKIMVDPTIALDHIGPHTWTGMLQDSLKSTGIPVSPKTPTPNPGWKSPWEVAEADYVPRERSLAAD